MRGPEDDAVPFFVLRFLRNHTPNPSNSDNIHSLQSFSAKSVPPTTASGAFTRPMTVSYRNINAYEIPLLQPDNRFRLAGMQFVVDQHQV